MNIQDCFSFRIDWLDLPAVQGTLKSLLQHQCFNAILLGASALGRPRGMVWGGRRVQDGEHMYTCVKNSPANAGDAGEGDFISRSGRSPREGNGNPLQYSCLENPMDGGAQQATVHGVAELDMTEATQHACMHGQGWGSRI